MVVSIDSVANSGAVSPPSHPIPNIRQTPIQPGTDRARSNDRQQKDQANGGTAFRAELDAVESAAEKFAAEVSARRAERKAAAQDKSARTEKRPDPNPAEVDAADSADLFARTQGVQARSSNAQSNNNTDAADGPTHIPASHEFLLAASRYAERVFAQGGAYAKPGESLELTA
ncbi:MAG: hypothetical protein JNM81_04385 [Rhodospirillaceae bacterium]|nr:hypothetical protein [Rhodospirillaceae bacterium]